MNKYDEAIRIWIARKLSSGKFVTADQISDVRWGVDGGYYYSSYTWEPDSLSFKFKLNGEEDYIQIEHMNPVKLIEECMKIYNEVLKYIPESY